jgi:Cdc6-like AAA superfamily ATPase
MAIAAIDEDSFKKVLRNNLTPARAISDPAHLRGRAKALKSIEWAFNSPGKHVFIYGDRGVGKTSLAQTAATIHQSSDSEPIKIACDEFVSFSKMVEDMARSALPPREVIEQRDTARKAGFGGFGLSAEVQEGIRRGVIPPVESLNDATLLLKYVASFHSREPVVIVDEFDQIKEAHDKKRFADLIKQVSDQEINIKFIFCGIGKSLEELIGVHLSTDRYLAPIAVEPLSHDSLWDILSTTATTLNVSVGAEENIRISKISDGFPYYVHLIGEHMFRSMYYDDKVVAKVNLKHFDEGVRGAVSEALGSLKQAYQLAIQKRTNDYEEVLWAVADGTMLERQTAEIYEKSYLPIIHKRNSRLVGKEKRPVLDQPKFYQRMNSLKKDSHGSILIGSKQGWYRFRENWMRGYVRLSAEQHQIPLGVDHMLAGAPDHRPKLRIE